MSLYMYIPLGSEYIERRKWHSVAGMHCSWAGIRRTPFPVRTTFNVFVQRHDVAGQKMPVHIGVILLMRSTRFFSFLNWFYNLNAWVMLIHRNKPSGLTEIDAVARQTCGFRRVKWDPALLSPLTCPILTSHIQLPLKSWPTTPCSFRWVLGALG